MGAASKIEWCDDTFNPWIGCQKVGPGCDHCYAEDWNRRYGAGRNWGPGAPRRLTANDNWKKPLKWNREAASWGRPRLVFCASLADWADNAAPAGARRRLFELIKATPNLIWILVSKRVGNILGALPDDWGDGYSNVCLVVTVCTQEEADRDIPKLLRIPAAIRGVSMEPLLGLIDVRPWLSDDDGCEGCDTACEGCPTDRAVFMDGSYDLDRPETCQTRRVALDWVILGGESGPNARRCEAHWIETPLAHCRSAGVAVFNKQLGARFADPRNGIAGKALSIDPDVQITRRLRGAKGGDPDEWPAHLRVQQFPPQFRHPHSLQKAA